MRKNLSVILYKTFLYLLLLSQIWPLLNDYDIGLFDIITHFVVAGYLTFRLYIFYTLKDKASVLDLTLTEFLDKRNKFMGKH